MKGRSRKFRDGEIIFQEGDASRAAFEILSGQVELSKKAGAGNLHLAILGTGEIFGEMGILDDGPRTATATARGTVKISMIARTDFLVALQNEPKRAAEILEKLASRLRHADEMLVQENGAMPAHPVAPPATAVHGPSVFSSGFWSQLFTGGKTRKNTIEIAVANLAGDVDGSQSKMVVDAFAAMDGIGARALNRELAPEPDTDVATQLATLAATGRQWLANANADVLIWGAVTDEGRAMRLRFLSAVDDDMDRPGVFVTANWLDLPTVLDEQLVALLQAVACAAAIPIDAHQQDCLKQLLPERLAFLTPLAKHPPLTMDRTSQAGLQVCLATANAALAFVSGDLNWYEFARDILRDAVRTLGRSPARLDWALASKRLGILMGMLASGDRAPDDLTEAAQHLRSAVKALAAAGMPNEWAGANLRLGSLLYRLDSKFEAEGALLREAATSFRDALTVYTLESSPYKWAETKNNLAQVLQILGGQQRSAELLKRAVDCGLDALQVRTRETMPQQWAATQNNIGSAYFLLARLTEDSEHLDGAEDAFRGARDVYRTLGGAGQAQVAERNLARVAELAAKVEDDRPLPIVKFDWDDQEQDAAAADDDGDDANGENWSPGPPDDGQPEATVEMDPEPSQRKNPRALDEG